VTAYETVLFDSDGVLVEPPTPEVQAAATRAAFRAVGVGEVDQQSIDDVIAGVTVDRLHDICASYDLDPATFWAAREAHDERSQFEQFEAGTRSRYDDVTAILDLECPCGVVSNNHHSTIEFVLERFDLEATFDTYYGRPKTIESLSLKKPNPHYLEQARIDLDGDPESTLYVGDSESDVVAAERAGMDSVFVRRSHRSAVSLSADPTHEVDTLHGVVDVLTG